MFDPALTIGVLEDFETMPDDTAADDARWRGIGQPSAYPGALGRSRADAVMLQLQRTKEANDSNLAMLQRRGSNAT